MSFCSSQSKHTRRVCTCEDSQWTWKQAFNRSNRRERNRTTSLSRSTTRPGPYKGRNPRAHDLTNHDTADQRLCVWVFTCMCVCVTAANSLTYISHWHASVVHISYNTHTFLPIMPQILQTVHLPCSALRRRAPPLRSWKNAVKEFPLFRVQVHQDPPGSEQHKTTRGLKMFWSRSWDLNHLRRCLYVLFPKMWRAQKGRRSGINLKWQHLPVSWWKRLHNNTRFLAYYQSLKGVSSLNNMEQKETNVDDILNKISNLDYTD